MCLISNAHSTLGHRRKVILQYRVLDSSHSRATLIKPVSAFRQIQQFLPEGDLFSSRQRADGYQESYQ